MGASEAFWLAPLHGPYLQGSQQLDDNIEHLMRLRSHASERSIIPLGLPIHGMTRSSTSPRHLYRLAPRERDSHSRRFTVLRKYGQTISNSGGVVAWEIGYRCDADIGLGPAGWVLDDRGPDKTLLENQTTISPVRLAECYTIQ